MSQCLMGEEALIDSVRKKALLVICYFKYHVLMVLALADVIQEWNGLFLSQKYTILFFSLC